MFRSPYDHPQGLCQALLKLHYVPVNMLMVHSVTLARLDILPEDGPMGTETCRRFYEI